MGVEILSKEGCQYCDLTVDLCKEYKLENKSRINLNSKVSAGLYFVKIISSSQSIIFKLIKK